jgi:hypothetical protein
VPADGTRLLALDVTDGHVLWEHAREQTEHLGGVVGDTLLLLGDECMALRRTDGELRWARPVPRGGYQGRGLLTREGLLAPGARYLFRLDPVKGGVLKRWRWPERQDQYIIALGPTGVLYTVSSTHVLRYEITALEEDEE